ncbi:iron transporter [Natronosalvus vescus]|uniref:iron transporter n=1 Tax=Natronosalvus vescus TaxID=2953881 RepID=UPI0020912110|nr:iron transporter [Natronosalvus vescus]
MTDDRHVSRRRLLESSAISASVLALAGCLGGDDDDSNGGSEGESDDGDDSDSDSNDDILAFPEIEDPPEAVYLPTHRERMRMLEPVEAGDYLIGPMLTYPHPFWLTDGTDVERVDPTAEDDVHLMVTAWDRETGHVLPLDSSPVFELYREGEFLTENRPWLMISQQMGFHFGDNVALEGDGSYRVEGRINPVGVHKTGAFEGRFEEAVEFAFEFEYDDELRALATDIEYFPEEEWGERGALEPMGHGDGDDGGHHDDRDDDQHDDHGDEHHDDGHAIPYSALPPVDDLPGTYQDTLESGDAAFAITLLESDTRFADDGWYLAVSPRTPYNRCVLPLMALEVTVEGEGHALTETMDHELGHHYGVVLESEPDGANLDLEVVTPPQVSRHRGYETAFRDMSSMSTVISR